MHSLYLAWKYLNFHKARTLALISCITIIAVLPLALEVLLNESERQLTLRAESSPLLIGAKGSSLDLVMNTLYFSDELPEPITMAAVNEIMDSELADPIPLYVKYKARSFPIVGTTLDYFPYRGLELAEGDMFSILGQCVIGANVGRKLDLGVGDAIVSSPETLFDLAGVYPLKMRIAGVLKPTNDADDNAVFVDIATAWVIEGLGHGHQDVTSTNDNSVILKKEQGNVVANAKLMQFTEITEQNIDSFHLHGDPSTFPVTAVLTIPYDEKSGTILQGRYLKKGITSQIIRPKDVIDDLMATIFRIRNVLDAVISIVGFATVLALLMVFSLSLKLRERELAVISRIGCSKATTVKLVGSELLILFCVSAVMCSLLLASVGYFDRILVRELFIN